MPDWFDFAGKRSAALGVYIKAYPSVPIAKERVSNETVPGRSGSLTTTEGEAVYDDIVLSLPCRMGGLADIDQVAAWLRGDGVLVLGDTPTRYYKARCSNQMDLARILRCMDTREFNAVFRCDPYRYIFPQPAAKTCTTSPDSINNPGTVDAVPFITVVGSGDIDLTVGARTIHIAGLASSITIDADTGFALNGTTDLTSTVTFDAYPWTIPPGINAVSWTGAVTGVTITRPWRYV